MLKLTIQLKNELNFIRFTDIVFAQKTSHKNDLKLDINLIGSIIFLNNFFFDKNFNQNYDILF